MGGSGRYDYILIESSGISEPMPVAETFTFQDLPAGSVNVSCLPPPIRPNQQQEALMNLSAYVRLDTLVTVVDASTFKERIKSVQQPDSPPLLKRARMEEKLELPDLMTQQIEFADVIIVNKKDRVNSSELESIKKHVLSFNPNARLYESVHAKVDASCVVNTSLFSFEKAQKYGNWLAVPRNETVSEVEEYNVTAFEYVRTRPFHPTRLAKLFERRLPGVLRGKGFLWLSSRNDIALQWSQAGSQEFSLSLAGPWFAQTVETALHNELPRDEIAELVKSEFDSEWGDRRQHLMLIGVALDRELIESMLDECLLTEAEMRLGVERWKKFVDIFPRFSFDGESINDDRNSSAH